MLKYNYKLVSLLSVVMFLLIFSSNIFAATDVIAFTNYDTKNILSGSRLMVEKNIVIRNTGNNPIIPGELHFEVFELNGRKRMPSEVLNLYAHNNGNKLSSRNITMGTYTDIIVDVWNPLLSDFEVPITITYDLGYKRKGVLFHDLTFPVEETTVQIDSYEVRLLLPKKYHVTYAPNAQVTNNDMYRVITWDNVDDDMNLEYSIVPLPKMPFKAVSLFWTLIIAVVVLVTVVLFKKFKK